MDAVLTGKGISVAYQQNIIIPSMDVEIPRGCVTSVIGPNGCGKSTLLKALSRMLPVRSGQVLLDGGMIARMPAAEVAKQMAILPQGPQAPGGLTVAELVAYGRYPHQKGFGRLRKEDYEAIDRALEMHIWRNSPKEISMRCPADSGSVPGSPWRLPRIHRSYCWMSPQPTWIWPTSWKC